MGADRNAVLRAQLSAEGRVRKTDYVARTGASTGPRSIERGRSGIGGLSVVFEPCGMLQRGRAQLSAEGGYSNGNRTDYKKLQRGRAQLSAEGLIRAGKMGLAVVLQRGRAQLSAEGSPVRVARAAAATGFNGAALN